MLLPLIIKERAYFFYEGYLVHHSYLSSMGEIDYLINEQEDKPRYLPGKEEFLKHQDEKYKERNWEKVYQFLVSEFGQSEKISKFHAELIYSFLYGVGMDELHCLQEEYGIAFASEEQSQRMISLIINTANDSPIWENKGHSPRKMMELFAPERLGLNLIPQDEKRKIGRNEPCPCGSGKKYKKCCALTEDANLNPDYEHLESTKYSRAHLNPKEGKEFYEIYYGLLGYVNAQKKIIKKEIKREYPNRIPEHYLAEVRDALWWEPQIIDCYLSEVELAKEEVKILKAWRKHHLVSKFMVLNYQSEYALFIDGKNSQGGNLKAYGVKGIESSVAGLLRREPPYRIEAVLLPFKGTIVFDGFLKASDTSLKAEPLEKLLSQFIDVSPEDIITSWD